MTTDQNTSDYYNPAKDEAKLQAAMVDPLPFDGWPSRWKRCLAAEVLELRAALTARERQLEVANKLWQLCVEEDFPWADGSTQDALTDLGLLYPKDMTDEDPSERCKNCDDDCETCWRAVDKLEDLK